MRNLVFIVIIMIVLSACGHLGRSVEVWPSPTVSLLPSVVQEVTSTVAPSETPVPSPSSSPAPPAIIFTDFPLAVGATWQYAAEISYQDPNDHTKLMTWTGIVTDKIVDRSITSDGEIVFTMQEDLEPLPPWEVWRQPNTYEYTVSDNGVFRGPMKIYQWPLADGITWKAFSDFDYEMRTYQVGEVDTPYGQLENCYVFFFATNPGASQDTFCPGVGFVMYTYSHHGTPQNEELVLTSFTPGQP